MTGLETLGWIALASMIPGGILIGIRLAVWEYEHGAPKWVEKLSEFLIRISDKYF